MPASIADARVLVDELVAQGVGAAVLSPGSRSAPLAYALYAAANDGRIELHVRIDERSAGFTALGMAKVSGAPVVVVTTSGTAVANLHPAVLEAAHSGIPLIAMTADRPLRLRGVGANQTIDQVGVFGPAVRLDLDVGGAAAGLLHGTAEASPAGSSPRTEYFQDVVVRALAAATGALDGNAGPVHLNVAFDEPLVPSVDGPAAGTIGSTRRVLARPSLHASDAYELSPLDGTVVVAGDGAGPAARALAEDGGWPLFAEPSSGAYGGANTIPAYRLLLGGTGLADAIRRVVVLGRPTLSRPITRLLAREGVDVVVVAQRPQWADPSRRAGLVVPAVTTLRGADQESKWLAAWRAAGERAAAAVEAVLAEDAGLTGLAVAVEVLARLGDGALLVAGSSNPIRDVDLVWPAAFRWDPGRAGITVLANRGVAGIDGTVSTAVGAALAAPGRRSYALLGDLTFLHDSNGLLIGPLEVRPDLTIVVVNDGGGGIFHLLEPGEPSYAEPFERVFGTPHGADLGALCTAHRVGHVRVRSRSDLNEALGAEGAGLRVIEAVADRSGLRDLHQRIAARVTGSRS